MHHLCSLFPQTPLPTTTRNYLFSYSLQLYNCHGYIGIITRRNSIKPPRRSKHQWRILAMEEKEPKYEVDPDKARQALDELDQQLESLSIKQTNPPKIRASSIGNLREQVKEEPPEISESFLGYTAFVLFAFTVFYNIIFITIIKPSIDGPDKDIVATVPTDVTRSYQAPDVSQQ